MIRVITDSCSGSAPESLESVTARQGRIWTAIDRTATAQNVGQIDLRDRLCPQGICAVQQGAVLMYREYLHLTVPAVISLTSEFARVL